MGQSIPMQVQGVEYALSASRIYCVNYQPDWLTVFYRKTVSVEAWQALAVGLEVSSCGLRWSLSLARETATSRVSSDDGLYIKALNPEQDWSEAARLSGTPPQYPCEIQVQGHAWSQGVGVLELLSELERLLGLEGAERVCGRVDLAADFVVSQETYDALVCFGSIPLVKESYVMRARNRRVDYEHARPRRASAGDEGEPARAALVGSGATSLYLGTRGGLQLVIYRKDIEFEGNTGALLHDRWLAAGWLKGQPVARIEVRLSREWLREHWIDGVKGAEVGPERVLDQAGALWRSVLDSYRLCPRLPGSKAAGTRRHRATCGAWVTAQGAWDAWEGLGGFAAVEQVPDRSKLVETTSRRIEDMRLAFSPVEFEALVREIVAGMPASAEYRDTKSKWRRYAYVGHGTDQSS